MKKSFISKLKELFESEKEVDETIESKFIDVKDNEGRLFRVDGDMIAVDAKVQEILEDGTLADVEDKTYTLEDESTFTTVGSIITEMTEAPDAGSESESEDSIEDPATEVEVNSSFKIVSKFTYDSEKFAIIKEVYKYDIIVDQSEFKVGGVLTYTNDEEEVSTLYSGTYEVEDGRMLTVNNEGLIILITDADGVVLESTEVGDNTDVVAPTDSADLSSDESETLSRVKESIEQFNELKVKYSELESEFEKFKKESSVGHTVISVDFKEENKNEFKSVLHSMLK